MSEPTSPAGVIRQRSGTMTVMGVLLALLGIVAMCAPLVTGIAVALMVGVALLAGGIAQTVFAFRAKSPGRGAVALLVGGITILAGLLMIGRPGAGLGFLTIMLAVYFVVSGIGEVLFAIELRPRPGWIWTLVSGGFAIVLGVMIWRQWPFSGGWAIGLLVGLKMLFAGWSMVALGAAGGALADEAESAAA